MTADELWQRFVARYPRFSNPDNTFRQTSRGFERSIRQAYEEGRKAGKQEAKRNDPFDIGRIFR